MNAAACQINADNLKAMPGLITNNKYAIQSPQIAILINGKIEGNPDATVDSFGKIEEAQNGQLAFLANPKYEDYLYTTKASIIIVNETQELKEPVNATLIRVPDAYTAFATFLQNTRK